MELPTYRHARLLGIGHKARQGKDLAVKLLREMFPGRVERVAFADALRVICRVSHGMTIKDAPLLQRVGVEARKDDPLVWVRAVAWAIAEMDADATEPFLVCIPDTRFENEAAFVAARGATCRIRRVRDDGTQILATDRPANHVTEIELDDYPWQFTVTARDGHIDDLRDGIRAVGETLLR
jgi:hypothetical protein